MNRTTGKEFPVKKMQDLESLGHRMKWQFFERLVAFVFEQNEWKVSVNVVKHLGHGKRQYDVIAASPRHIFAADCKRWTGRRYKASLLRAAAGKQIERCMWLKPGAKNKIIPLIVTLMPEDIIIHDGVPIVPILMLNTFIRTWEENDDEIRQI